MSELLIIGFGYSAAAIAAECRPDMHVRATIRGEANIAKVEAAGVEAVLFDGARPSPALAAALASATHLLVSAPPGEEGDPLLCHHRLELENAPRLAWIGYLSTVGVYGNHQGRWVDETTMPRPSSRRAKARVEAEQDWLEMAAKRQIALQIFRLGGIYGPGRNTLCALADGSQRRIVKPGQVFNRIHVADIAGLVKAGMARPHIGPILNGVDDEPAPPQDVVVYASNLMGLDPPPETSLEAAGLSPMGLSFYAENKRVSNRWSKQALGFNLRYPTYRDGLSALAAAKDWQQAPPPDA